LSFSHTNGPSRGISRRQPYEGMSRRLASREHFCPQQHMKVIWCFTLCPLPRAMGRARPVAAVNNREPGSSLRVHNAASQRRPSRQAQQAPPVALAQQAPPVAGVQAAWRNRRRESAQLRNGVQAAWRNRRRLAACQCIRRQGGGERLDGRHSRAAFSRPASTPLQPLLPAPPPEPSAPRALARPPHITGNAPT